MSKYKEDEQMEKYIKQEKITKKDLLKLFDQNLDLLEDQIKESSKIFNNIQSILFNLQMIRDSIEFYEIV